MPHLQRIDLMAREQLTPFARRPQCKRAPRADCNASHGRHVPNGLNPNINATPSGASTRENSLAHASTSSTSSRLCCATSNWKLSLANGKRGRCRFYISIENFAAHWREFDDRAQHVRGQCATLRHGRPQEQSGIAVDTGQNRRQRGHFSFQQRLHRRAGIKTAVTLMHCRRPTAVWPWIVREALQRVNICCGAQRVAHAPRQPAGIVRVRFARGRASLTAEHARTEFLSCVETRRNPGMPTRDWRLAALGSSCCSLGIACLMLVACSTAPQRPTSRSPSSTPSTDASMRRIARAAGSAVVARRRASAIAMATPAPAAGHARLRLQSGVRRWAHTYTQNPTQFAASMGEAMPYLLVVLDEIERRDCPANSLSCRTSRAHTRRYLPPAIRARRHLATDARHGARKRIAHHARIRWTSRHLCIHPGGAGSDRALPARVRRLARRRSRLQRRRVRRENIGRIGARSAAPTKSRGCG